MHYTKLPQFKHLLRKYTKQDVQSLVLAAGVCTDHCKDASALECALRSLDRLMGTIPEDEEAREEKRSTTRRINAALDNL